MTFRLDIYEDNDLNGASIGSIDLTQSAISARFTDVLHGAGSMELVLPRHHADAALLQRDRAGRLVTNAGTVALFFLEEGKVDLSSADEKGGEFIKWEGRGALAILDRGVMDNDSNIAGGKDPIDLFWDLSAQGDFAGASNGHPIPMMKRALVEVALNPPNAISLVDHSGFDYDLDSDAAAVPFWDGVFGVDVGESLYNLAGRLDQLGGFIQRMSDTFVYDMYLSYGANKAGAFGVGTVRFEKGINVAVALQRKVNPNVTRTHLVVRGANNAFLTVANPSYTAGDVVRWGSLSVNESDGLGAMEEAALNNFAARERASDAYVLPMPAHGNDPANGIYEPNVHFKVGDLVTAHTGSGVHDLNAVSVPVAAITWRTKDGTDYVYDVELGYNYHWTEGPEAQFGEMVGCVCPRGTPVCQVQGEATITDIARWTWTTNELDDTTGTYLALTRYTGDHLEYFAGPHAHVGNSGAMTQAVDVTAGQTLFVEMQFRWKWDPSTRPIYVDFWTSSNPSGLVERWVFESGAGRSVDTVYLLSGTHLVPATANYATITWPAFHGLSIVDNMALAVINPAEVVVNSPYCETDPGSSPFWLRSDSPRILALETTINVLTTQVGAWKMPVRVATTAAGTLATSFENGDTIDGVVLATGDRILLKNQATGADNGIYTVNASGAPTRAADFNESDDVLGAAVLVTEGTANADTVFILTTNAPITLGTTALVFAEVSGGVGGGRPPYDYVVAAADSAPDLQAIADAVCDGTADEVEINAAIAAAVTADRPYSILLLPGTYVAADADGLDFTPLTAMGGNWVVFEASGTTIIPGANLTTLINLAPGAGGQIITCADIRLGAIDGADGTFTVTQLVNIARFNDNILRIVDVRNGSGIGVKVAQSGITDYPCGNNKIDIEIIHNMGGTAFLATGGTNAFGFQGNTVHIGEIIACDNGIVLGESANQNAKYNTFICGVIEHNTNAGIYDYCGGNTFLVGNLNTNGTEIGGPSGMTLRSTYRVHIDLGSSGGIDAAVLAQHYVQVNGLGPGSELDYVQITSNVSVTATTEGTANAVVTGNAVVYDGFTTILIDAYIALANPSGSSSLVFILTDGGSAIGELGTINTSAGIYMPLQMSRRLTPTAASHTYGVEAYTGAGTATVFAGAGGAGAKLPCFIRITKVR